MNGCGALTSLAFLPSCHPAGMVFAENPQNPRGILHALQYAVMPSWSCQRLSDGCLQHIQSRPYVFAQMDA
jgi:hypothetical protein